MNCRDWISSQIANRVEGLCVGGIESSEVQRSCSLGKCSTSSSRATSTPDVTRRSAFIPQTLNRTKVIENKLENQLL